MQLDQEATRARIRRAFANVPVPTRIEDMRLSRYTGDDSFEMAAALVGKKWTELPVDLLFVHRESLHALGGAAYRAYLPAYLDAAIAADDPMDKYGADLRHYLLACLEHWPHQKDEHRGAETRERLALLDPDQRAAVADVLRYLEARWQTPELTELLRDW